MIRAILLLALFTTSAANAASTQPVATTQPRVEEVPLGKLDAYEQVKQVIVSGDDRHAAFIAARGDRQFLVVDGVEKARAEWFIPDSLAMTHDGSHLAYAMQTSTQTIPIIDGMAGEVCFALGGNRIVLHTQGQHYAYVAQQDNGKSAHAVIDGKPGPDFQAVDLPIFSKDGQHVAYRAHEVGRERIVLDGRPLKAYPSIVEKSLAFDPSKPTLAYEAIDGARHFVVINETEYGPFDAVRLGPGFSEQASHWAAVVAHDQRLVVLLDAKPQKPCDAISAGNFVFSEDGQHFAYGASDAGKEHVVVDGVDQPAFDQLAPASLRFSPDGKHLAYVGGTGGKLSVVVDDHRFDAGDGILPQMPLFAPGSKAVYFAVNHGSRWRLARVGLADFARADGPELDAIVLPTISPDGQRIAYRCVDGPKLVAMIDGVPTESFNAIAGLVFSPDSKHIAWMAGSNEKTRLYVDGVAVSEPVATRLSTDRPAWDGNNSLHLIAVRNGTLVRLSVHL